LFGFFFLNSAGVEKLAHAIVERFAVQILPECRRELRALVVGSADRQSRVTQQPLKLVVGMQELKHNPKHTL